MSLKNWKDLNPGGVNTDAGNSAKDVHPFSNTGKEPLFIEENCINCFFCWVFCPENAIILENDQVRGINYDFCKGCGICANECPVQKEPQPLVMVEKKMEL